MLLALDTSVDIAVALVDDDAPTSVVLAERRVAEQRRHAELLSPLVAEVLADAGVDRTALARVVVGTGPAPFTGLRAGLVTARTLAFALDVPVLGVGSLDGLAAQAFRDGDADDEVVVVTDARRREVYWARYRRGADGVPVVVHPPAVERPDAVADAARDVVVVGPATRLHPDVLGDASGPEHVEPGVLATIALAREAAGLAQPTEPLYLRRPDVTPSAGRKRATA